MYCGAHIQAVLLRIHADPAPGGVPPVERGIQEHAHRAEHHNGGHSHGNILGASPGHGGCGQHRRRTANGAACTDEQRGAPVQPQHPLAQPAGQPKGAGQRQGVDGNATPAHVGDVLEGQTQAVQHDACAQQLLFGQAHAGRTGLCQAWV